MSRIVFLIIVMSLCGLMGCRTAQHNEPTREALDAIGSVTGALTGKELTEAEKRKVLNDLKTDKEAQSAMQSISGALEVKQSGIRYCPVDGKRFSSTVDECPEHKVKLKELTD